MIVPYSPKFRGSSFIWAMKTVPTDTNRAVPSILTVAPIGSTKREIRGSTPHLSFMQRKVMGSVAALWKEGVLVHHQGVGQFQSAREVMPMRHAPRGSTVWTRAHPGPDNGNPVIDPAWLAPLLQGLANMIIVTHPHRPGTGFISETNKQTRLLYMFDSDWEWGGYSVMGAGVTVGWGPVRLQHKREPLTQPWTLTALLLSPGSTRSCKCG